jgi:hypothetical protein
VIAFCALIALCSGVPVVDQQAAAEVQLRIDIYNDLLQNLFPNIMSTIFDSITNAINHLIQSNPTAVMGRADGLNLNIFSISL